VLQRTFIAIQSALATARDAELWYSSYFWASSMFPHLW
jgi:hypothetical protein